MLSVTRLVSFWRCIPVQYNCQKSSNFQGLSHFSRIFGKNDKIPGFFQAGKTVTIFPDFPGAVGTLYKAICQHRYFTWRLHFREHTTLLEATRLQKLYTCASCNRIYLYIFRLSTRLCEKKGFFKRFDFQKKRFLQQKKRFSVPNG